MSERKNIERLFQEKFKDFEAAPSPKVWENIASKLEKKENKRRIIPLWLKASGIAASLLLGYFIVDNYTDVTSGFNSTENNNETVVSSELAKERSTNNDENASATQQNSTPTDHIKDNQDLNQLNQENAIVINENATHSRKSSSKINTSSRSINLNQSNTASDQSVVSSEKKNADNTSSFEKSKKAHQINSKTQFQQNNSSRIVNNDKPKKLKKGRFNPSYINENQPSSADNEKQSVAQNSKSKKVQGKDYNSSVNDKNQGTDKNNPLLNSQSRNDLALNSKKDKNNSDNSDSRNTSVLNSGNQDPKGNSNVSAANSNQNSSIVNSIDQHSKENNAVSAVNSNQKSSIVNPDNQNSNLLKEKQKDSIAIAMAEENPLEKILKEKEKKDKQETIIAENTPKWKVRPNVAPLFMSASKGSPIDGQFVDNTKNYENNMSFGLGVDYALSPKFTIRTGINKFDLGYNTNDIVYYSDLESAMSSKGLATNTNVIQTINMKPQASGMIIEDRNISESKEIASQYKKEGFLNQSLGYLEVPFELSYKVIDKKFGIQVITGLSTLFLNKNQVSVVSSGMATEIGEANNLNKVHFSTNVGLGFKYSFWKSFEANFEPTFKYQINTFNANSGGFKPYIIGLYTGLSFKF